MIAVNIRFRPTQLAALDLLENDETDRSALVRMAVDEYLKEKKPSKLVLDEQPKPTPRVAVGKKSKSKR